jgi:hypothetical protein
MEVPDTMGFQEFSQLIRKESWLGKTAQWDKWIFCLMAARAAA